MAAWLPKKAGGMFCTGFYTGRKMMWAMAHAIFQTFVMMHFTSLYGDVGTKHTNIVAWWETASQGKWQPVTKTGGLGGVFTSTQRSAVWEMPKYHYIFLVIISFHTLHLK